MYQDRDSPKEVIPNIVDWIDNHTWMKCPFCSFTKCTRCHGVAVKLERKENGKHCSCCGAWLLPLCNH